MTILNNKKMKINKNKIKFFNDRNNSHINFYHHKKNEILGFTKKNKEKKIDVYNKINNNKIVNISKFKYYERKKNIFNIIVEKFLMICLLNFILLNINGILCESYIIVKINKKGKFNFLFNGLDGTYNDDYEPCKGVSMHIPNSVNINGDDLIDLSDGQYDFIRDKNTIKLVYDDAMENFECLFYGCSNIDEIDASHLITSNVKNMKFMFFQCTSLTSLNLSYFDTRNVESMKGMFGNCSSLTSINVSSFNTPSLKNIARTFEGCSSLSSIYLSNFDTSEVTYMNRLFYECSSLTTLDISKFITSKVEWMSEMFRYCYLLTTLDLSNFDTSKVIYFYDMFNSCKSLISLNLLSFNTCKAQTTAGMFSECNSLQSLDLSKFDTSQVTDMSYMFYNCWNLKSLNLNNIITTNVENMNKMFYECYKLESLDISSFRTQKVKSMSSMFTRCISLKTIDLSNFVFSSVTDIKYMFSGCSNLKLINLKNLRVEDNVESEKLVDNSLINPAIYIEDKSSLNKIISIYECHYLQDLENWGEYKNKIMNGNNEYVNGCLLSKCDNNFYQICSFYYYYDDEKNKYLCTEKLKCPEPYNKLINGKNECIKSCSETSNNKYDFILGNICLEKCPEYFSENDDNHFKCTLTNLKAKNQKSTIIEIMKSEMMKDILTLVLTNNESFTTVDKNDTYIISTLNTNLNRKNLSSIDFGICERLLRNESKINDSEALILYEIEHNVTSFNIPIIEYLVFTERGQQLNLSICNNMTIQYYIPVIINENEIDLYNPYSDIYNEECIKVKSKNGVDMTLYDRTKRFNDEDMSLCEKDCIYQGFDSDTKKVKCDCNLKNDMTYNNEETNPDDLLYKLDSSKSNSNMKVTKCINNVFNSPKNLVSNSGFLTLSLVLILFIIIFIIFCKKGTQLLEKKIDDVIYKKFYKKNKNVRIVDNNPKKANKNIKKVKTFKNKNTIPPKKNKLAFDSNINLKNRYNTSNRTKKNTKIINNSQKKTLFKENAETKKNNNKSVKVENKPDKNNDYELNSLTYKEAIKHDKRKCCDYYLSLLKNKQLFFFTFCSFNDYNSGIIKKFIFFLSFAIHYAISALFFNDDMMHQIYLDEGKYNISYQLPNILISAASSTVILRIMLEIFILTDRNVLQVKRQTTKNRAEKMKLQALKCIKIKFAFFFLINFIVLSLFWFYLTCLNGTYENTQLYLIESTLIAFAFSFGYPFIWNIFPSTLRICSLSGRNPNKGCLFYFSKFLQLI